MATMRCGDLFVRRKVPNMDSIGASLAEYEVLPGVRALSVNGFSASVRANAAEQARVERLAAQIRESQEINPLIVAIDDDGGWIVEGSHRIDALLLLGVSHFPAKVALDLESRAGRAIWDREQPEPERLTGTPIDD